MTITEVLGIPSYKPIFFDDPQLFLEKYRASFTRLIGKVISRFWLMWGEEEDEWYPDGPVILEIDGERYEFCCYKLDEFSFTLNEIDLNEQLEWYGLSDEMPLGWKQNGRPDLVSCLNIPITGVNILVYNFKSVFTQSGEAHETGFMMHGIELELKSESGETSYFSIFNALDENGLSCDRVEQDDQIRRIRVAGDNEV